MPINSEVCLVLGAQWGDEGKGKIVDVLAADVDLVCRCQGGSNAGHTVLVGDKEYKFHLIPSGITNEKVTVVIGNGVVLHIPTLMKEIDANSLKGIKDMMKRMKISDRTHLVFDMHQQVDGLLESLKGKSKIGTTKRGIGPTYATKALRNGLRMADLMGDFDSFSKKFQFLYDYHKRLFPELEVNVEEELKKYKDYSTILRPMVEDTIVTLHEALKKGSRVLIEGANATMLDIDFGTYPYVTSSNCGSAGACSGLGVPVNAIQNIYGVVKAYTTRVGAGILPTELLDDTGDHLQKVGAEFGTTTGRPRRCGWLDLVVVKYTHMVNGYSALAITKIDVLDDLDEIKVAVNYKMNGKALPSFPAHLPDLEKVEVEYMTLPGWKQSLKDIRKYDDLPENAKKYLKLIEEHVGVPVKWVSVGKSRDAIITVM
ncbi:adenylosuccinate synthetase-like [Hydractinia symbiolongicarpus]|uniref:adenylosuccinate synthetase-like n=1 Tax=Hydractinia symbiolongicarpus TaxID=13093 RepID=UPI00254BECC1|nr:adenylosuccinate synthetase-like [Hydractinia symbiolongicarpus]